MTISKILVPLRGDGKGEAVLSHAIALAGAFQAHVEALFCRPQTSDMLPYGVVVPAFLRKQIENSMDTVGSGEQERMRSLFNEYALARDVEVVAAGTVPPRDRVSLGWREALGRQADLLGLHGRLADLIVVPRPDHAQNLGFNTLYSALMNTGRPVLMAPAVTAEASPVSHVAIAWNGSMEAARAVALGIDLIQAAERITILTAGKMPGGTTAEDLTGYLAVRGVEAAHTALPEDDDIGARILSGAAKAGASMLLMGAYSHGRGRESLFGGVSQHVVDHASLPVVLVH